MNDTTEKEDQDSKNVTTTTVDEVRLVKTEQESIALEKLRKIKEAKIRLEQYKFKFYRKIPNVVPLDMRVSTMN